MSVSCSELSVATVTFDGATFLGRWMWPTVAHKYPPSNVLCLFSSPHRSYSGLTGQLVSSHCWDT